VELLNRYRCSLSGGRDPADDPLRIACRHGDAGIVRILLSGGAAVNGVDISGKTALHLAATAKPSSGKEQGCQMAYFLTKYTNLGKFSGALHWKMLVNFYCHLVYFVAIWYILRPFVISMVIFSRFGILYKEKSGNPTAFGVLIIRIKKNIMGPKSLYAK
jgi:hypothetical protein